MKRSIRSFTYKYRVRTLNGDNRKDTEDITHLGFCPGKKKRENPIDAEMQLSQS